MRYIDADKLYIDLDKSGYCYDNWLDVEGIILAQPTADVRENVRGEWRTTYLDHVAIGERPKILYCSVCNQCIAYPTNYCPNCGADMRGGSCCEDVLWCNITDEPMCEDDYCSKGDRL